MADRQETMPPQGYMPRRGPPYRGGDPGGQKYEKYSLDSVSGSVGYSHHSHPHSYSHPPLEHPADAERGPPLSMTVADDKQFEDHMTMALFSAVFCCWPVGIIGLMNARDARRSYKNGDTGRAYDSAHQARRYAIWSISIGTILVILIIMATIIILSYRL